MQGIVDLPQPVWGDIFLVLAAFISGFVAAFIGVGIWGNGAIRKALEMRRSGALRG